MTTVELLAAFRSAFRDFVTDGVPGSGVHEPQKIAIRNAFASLVSFIEGLITSYGSGAAVFATKAAMDGDLDHDDGDMAWVMNDPVAENNGIYEKDGASGVGSWEKISEFSFQGAIDAAVVAAELEIAEAGDEQALRVLGIFPETVYPTAAAALSNGVASASFVGGSGGTDGAYLIAPTGGGGANALALVTVSGGAITAVHIVSKGINYTTAPSFSTASITGLTGGSITALLAVNEPPGAFFGVSPPADTTYNLYDFYENVGGVATPRGSQPKGPIVHSVNGETGDVLITEYVAPPLKLTETEGATESLGRVYRPITFDVTDDYASLQPRSFEQTELTTAAHICWNGTAPGASRDGWLTGFAIGAGADLPADCTIQAWLVRPTETPPANLVGGFDVELMHPLGEWDLSDIAPVSFAPRLVFEGLFCRIKEGDTLVIRAPGGIRFPFVTVEGGSNEYEDTFSATFDPEDLTLDALAGTNPFENTRVYGRVIHSLRIIGGALTTLNTTASEDWALPDELALSRSSAGVYDGARLVRTLWNERPFHGRLTAEMWDGLDDEGNVAPSGDYTIKVMDASNIEWEWQGVVGNNSAQPPDEHWSPMDTVFSMAITSAGKAYVACGYDEARVGSHAFDITAPLVPHEVLPTTFRITGPAVYFTATDGTRAYFAGVGAQPNSSAGTRSAVWAVTVADDAAYTFSSGASFQGYNGGQTIASAISIILADPLCKPTGLAVQTTGNLLVVTRSAMDRLDVLHKTTGALIATITSLTAPRAVRFDPIDEGLWIAHATGGIVKVEKYTVNAGTGAITAVGGSAKTGLSDPLAIAISPDKKTLRIADGGTSQQIKSYTDGADVMNGAGAFSSNLMQFLGTSQTISGGKLNIDGTNADSTTQYNLALTQYGLYKVTYTIVRTSGTMRAQLGSATGALRSASGTYTDYIYVTGTNDKPQIRQFNFNGTVDDWVVEPAFSVLSTYGQATGYALGPAVTKDKLMFYNHQSITLGSVIDGSGIVYGAPWAMLEHQADGKLWVTDAGNRRVMRFNTSGGSITTFDTEICWIGSNYSASMNMVDPTQILSDFLEYELDYTKEPTEAGWWTLVNNWNSTVPPSHNSGQLRHYRFTTLSNGRRYVLGRDLTNGVQAEISELDPVAGFRRTGVTMSFFTSGFTKEGHIKTLNSPNAGSPIVFKERLLTGFDGSNNPTYAAETTIVTTPNLGADDTSPRSTSSDIAGWRETPGGVIPVWDPRHQHTGWHLSGVDSVTGEFVWKTMRSTPVNFARKLPIWPGDGYFPIYTVSSAGGHLYQDDVHIIANYPGEGASGYAQVNKRFHFHECGLMVQNFGPVLIGDGKDQRGMAGNASRGGFTIQDGKIYLISNDESYAAGMHAWRCSNLDSITFHEIDMTWDEDDYAALTTDPNNLLVGLPFDTTVTTGTAGWTRSPTTDDLTNAGTGPYWRVNTNYTEYDEEYPSDLDARHLLPMADAAAYIERALPNDLDTQWILSAEVALSVGDTGTSLSAPDGYCFVEIRDAADLIIARWKAHDYTPSSLWGIYGNGTAIATFASSIALTAAIFKAGQKLAIYTTPAGKIVFKYAGYDPIETDPLDPSADWEAPAKFRVTFDWVNAGGGINRHINFKKLRID